MVRHHRREPAHLLARGGDVVRDVARRAHDALERRGVAARLLGRRARRGHRPLDDVRVGQLDDHAVADRPGDREHLRAVAGHVHLDRRQLGAHPGELDARCRSTRTFSPFMNGLIIRRASSNGHPHRLLVDVAARGVAAADAHHHAPVRDVVQRRVGARHDGRLARARVRDHVAELDPLGRGRGQRQRRRRLLPEHVRVVGPAVLEAVRLGELDQLDQALIGRVRQNGDAEAEGHGNKLSEPRQPSGSP